MTQGEPRIVWFSLQDPKLSWLAPGFKRQIQVEGRSFPSVEHFVNAAKFACTDFDIARQVARARNGNSARQLAARQAERMRRDWVEVKDSVMLQGLEARFRQHEDLRAQLLATGSAVLAYRSESDFHYGCGFDRSGANRLGELLMVLREQLRAEEEEQKGQPQRQPQGKGRRKQQGPRRKVQLQVPSGSPPRALSREDSASDWGHNDSQMEQL